jgi:hypothetical protein
MMRDTLLLLAALVVSVDAWAAEAQWRVLILSGEKLLLNKGDFLLPRCLQ